MYVNHESAIKCSQIEPENKQHNADHMFSPLFQCDERNGIFLSTFSENNSCITLQYQCAVCLHTVAKGIMVRECLPSVMSAAVLICIMLLKMLHVFCNGCKSAQFITWSSESV